MIFIVLVCADSSSVPIILRGVVVLIVEKSLERVGQDALRVISHGFELHLRCGVRKWLGLIECRTNEVRRAQLTCTDLLG
jgi:hypothetical protein